MKFYVVFVQTKRLRVRVGGWDMDWRGPVERGIEERLRRRAERDQQIQDQIVMPHIDLVKAAAHFSHPGPRHDLPSCARHIATVARKAGPGMLMVTKTYEVDELKVDPDYRPPRFSYPRTVASDIWDNLPDTSAVTGTGTLKDSLKGVGGP